jgi:PAS domain S-box-containing protein
MLLMELGESSSNKWNWENADARVLGQIIAAQNIVFALPDTTRISEFYAQALISVPGITSCRVCLGDISAQAGVMESSVCAECEALRKKAKGNDVIITCNPDFKCNLADQPDIHFISIDFYQHHFGFFVFHIENTAVFDVYQPFIINLVNYIAISLENCLKRDLLKKANDELEYRVAERTADLEFAYQQLDATNQQLRESEERYRIVADNTYDWEFWIDPGGRHVYISPSCQRITGYTTEEFKTEPDLLMTIIHPDDRQSYKTHLIDDRNGHSVGSIEFRIINKDGQVRWIEDLCQPVFDKYGKWLGTRGSNRDITKRKRVEAEVRQLNLELERRVLERTAQLEAANQELEAFAYSVSHDLRAPLRHVDGFIELLKKKTAEKLDEQSEHYMSTIADAAKRMGTLIDDLLSFSRMGRSMMTTEPVNLGELVRDVILEYEPDLRGRCVNWHIADLPLVTGDCAMLRVVLVNLISNALKFTRPRPQAEIEIGWLVDQDTATVIFVRDNGVGFEMNYADKLFGVFQRLHRSDEFEGTGIGLASVRRVVHRHGGKTWAEGRINQGATFYFSLPRPT